MWLANFGDNVLPPMYKLMRAQTTQDIEEGIKTLEQKLIFIAKHSKYAIGSEGSYFTGTPQFTVIDCCILPFLERVATVLKLAKNADIFANRNSNEEINKWYKYWQFARQRPSFQRTLYDLTWMKELPQNPLTQYLEMKDTKSFNGETYMLKALELYSGIAKAKSATSA